MSYSLRSNCTRTYIYKKTKIFLLTLGWWEKFQQTKLFLQGPNRLQKSYPQQVKEPYFILLPQFSLMYAAQQLHVSEQYGRLFLRCREPPWVSLKSELCLYTANTNRVYIKDIPPTVTAKQILSLSLLPPCFQPIALSSLFLSFPPFSLSLYFPPLVVLVGWSVTLLCAHWPVAR